jgi:pullulanase/glycogen debranching enzyme
MLAFRQTHPVLRREAFYTPNDILWFGPAGQPPDWEDKSERCLACRIRGQGGPDLYLMFNASADQVGFVLPRTALWWRIADTGAPPPGDACVRGDEIPVTNQMSYTLRPYSSVILIAR